MAPYVINHNLVAGSTGRADEAIAKCVIRSIEANRGICSLVEKFAENAGIATSRDNFASSEQLCDLHGEPAGDSRCAENQHAFTWLEVGPVGQCEPRGNTGVRQGSSCSVIKPIRNRKAKSLLYNRMLRHRSIGRPCSKVDPLAIRKDTHPVRAADHRKLTRASVVGTLSHLLINLLQCRSAYLYKHVAIAKRRLGKRFVARAFP